MEEEAFHGRIKNLRKPNMKYALAIDIGASSGRHILAHKDEKGTLNLEEIYRFKTPLVQEGNGHCHWDVDELFFHVKEGLKKAKELGKIPTRLAIDCFGVDYALLDDKDQLVGEVVSYRDVRTEQAKKEFLTPLNLFLATGVAPQSFDTAYQLYCDKKSGKLAKAKTMLFLPSYLCYLLTGVKANEVSVASTGAILNARTTAYSYEVLHELDISRSFFPPLKEAGTKLGSFKKEIVDEIGYDAFVYLTLEHDTAAAFYGSGAHKDEILLSSGTWSLLGLMLDKPIITNAAYEDGFTNELNRKHEVRFLKNIMGMWLINNIQNEEKIKTIQEVVTLARKGAGFDGVFDAADPSLLNPQSMKMATIALLRKNGTPPQNISELLYAVYHSLAKSYAKAIKDLEKMTQRQFRSIRIFGGGVEAKILNDLTEKETGLKVNEGPSEATAIGNLKAIMKDW